MPKEEWRELYGAAVRVKEMAPWRWMTEAHVFGVEDPETEGLGFVSVMGMLGEYHAAVLYPNPVALYSFRVVEAAGPDVNPDALLEIPQIHASFEDRGELHEKDRKVIRELGSSSGGARSGRCSAATVRALRRGSWRARKPAGSRALEQLLDVAPRLTEDPALLEFPDDESYLVRVPRQEGGTVVWEDQVIQVPPELLPIEIEVDFSAFEGLDELGRAGDLEMDLFMLPAPVREGRGRPLFPYMLMAVDAGSAVVVANELLFADPSLEDMWASVPQAVADHFAATQTVPARITTASEPLYGLLRPLAETFDFELEYSEELPTLDQVRDFLLQSVYE